RGKIGPHARNGAHGSAFKQKRFAPRASFSRRPGANRPAILHQFGRPAVYSSGEIKRRRLRRVSRALREEEVTIFPGDRVGKNFRPTEASFVCESIRKIRSPHSDV